MTVRIEKDGPVWTVIHSRPGARNAMDPESAKSLFEAFQSFDADQTASVAVFWGEGGAFCAGWDLKHAASLEKWGEVIAAFILSDQPLDVADLRTHCRAHLSAQKTPSVWVRVPDFPLTGSGKVQKFAIREKFLAGNYGEVLQ